MLAVLSGRLFSFLRERRAWWDSSERRATIRNFLIVGLNMVLKQGKLFDERSIDDRFEQFLRDHPDVWVLFRRFAWELAVAGRKRGSADAIIHRIRWEHWTSSTGTKDFKINDHFSSRLARKMIAEYPSFADFFETRKLKS